ncbi:hypothetical protein [Methylobacterium gossipiicola]|uniref:Uncharacterized protein n=1 Tax=Methylobacterium gossipiicola TaxID=582675 RepID=A0A1I2UPQ4_9HYPH|nr:hypothetical protein [Methylobacterium gossipiicola]SFG79000.1 hypothetical protein SAMN05192565_11172 [Methylobacterium gossipiicola]
MTPLFREPITTVSPGRIVALGAIGLATMAMLGLLWWTFSPILGQVYAGMRLAETATLWRFTGWGQYFMTMPAGQPFAFVSIYKSSVGFGLVATGLTALLGCLAWRKRSREHIEVLITAPAPEFSQEVILAKFAPPLCRVRSPSGADETDAPAPVAVANPFAGLRDLRDARAVEGVAESVPWQFAAVLFLTIDAAAPLKDRKAHASVLKAAWTASDRFAADPAAPPLTVTQADLRSLMVMAISDQAGRDIDMLDRVHDLIEGAATLDDAVTQLASLALPTGRLFFPDYAWLRHVDPTLQSVVTSY